MMKQYHRFCFGMLVGSLFFFSCEKDSHLITGSQWHYQIHVISGNYQDGNNGEQLIEPIVIQVTDSLGNAQTGLEIRFEIVTGGGTVSGELSLTDPNGMAQTYWTLGNASEHIMKASLSDPDFAAESVYIFAQINITLNLGWISDIDFPRLFGYDVLHDNRILETNHYLVFSDGSSDDAKVRFAKIAEETFHEVMEAFEIQSSEELGIIQSDINTKPKLFSNVSTIFPYGGFAYNTGYVYPALDSNGYPPGEENFLRIYRPDVKHETVHIIQFLVGLDNLPNLWPDVWFSEGLAVYISNNRPPPANLQELDEWRQMPNNDNPIKVHEWEDYPDGGRRYYNMFGLAVKYLLHEDGYGKTTTDVLDMYRYMASSRNGFTDAFENFMGMTVQYYEENYWDLITDFLSQN